MTLQELDLAMEKSAAKFAVCENNWPKEAMKAQAIHQIEAEIATLLETRV